MSPKQHKYHHGVLLYSICRWLGVPKKDLERASKILHKELQSLFDIDSFANLSVGEYEKVASKIRVYFAVEKSLIIPEPDEADKDIESMSMSEFLKLKMP